MKSKCEVLAVISPKGGVGKTVTASNLAVALSTLCNKKVLTIDSNVTTASLGFHFNLIYPEVTIYSILNKNFSLSKAVHKYNENLHIIPASIVIEKKDRNIKSMQKNVKRIVNSFDKLLKQLVKKYDVVILDAAGGFSTESTATMMVADKLLLVTNPEYPAILATAKCIEYARLMKTPIGGLIVTKVKGKYYELTKKEIEEALDVKVIGTVPLDENVPKSIAHKMPVMSFRPYSKASIAYKKIAASVIGEKYNENLLGRVRAILKV